MAMPRSPTCARYPFADGDYQRVRNQRAYLNGVVGSLLDGGLLSPFAVRSAVHAVAQYVLTNPGFDSGHIGALAVSLRSVKPSGLSEFTVPTTGSGTENGQSVVYLDDGAVQDLALHLRKDSMNQFQACELTQC